MEIFFKMKPKSNARQMFENKSLKEAGHPKKKKKHKVSYKGGIISNYCCSLVIYKGISFNT